MNWRDNRLMFRHLNSNREAIVTPGLTKDLWTPLNELDFPNAIIGSLHADSRSKLFARANGTPRPWIETFSSSYEDFIFEGKDTTLRLTQKVRLQTICDFEFTKFPFDTHICDFIVVTKENDQGRISITGTANGFRYVGPKIVGQFAIYQADPRNESLELHQCPEHHCLHFA